MWDFVVQQSWFNREHKDKEYKVYCPCGKSHRELVESMKKDIKMSQLCCISYFYVCIVKK